jgi:hypothetical protein
MPTSSYVELKKSRKRSNPPAIGFDWIMCDRDGVGILKHPPMSCGDVAHAVGRDLRASKRMGGALERDARSIKWQLRSLAANAQSINLSECRRCAKPALGTHLVCALTCLLTSVPVCAIGFTFTTSFIQTCHSPARTSFSIQFGETASWGIKQRMPQPRVLAASYQRVLRFKRLFNLSFSLGVGRNRMEVRGSGQQTNTKKAACGVVLARVTSPVQRIVGQCRQRLRMTIVGSLAPTQPIHIVEMHRRHAY